jgi:hypothetical protein
MGESLVTSRRSLFGSGYDLATSSFDWFGHQ